MVYPNCVSKSAMCRRELEIVENTSSQVGSIPTAMPGQALFESRESFLHRFRKMCIDLHRFARSGILSTKD